MANGANATLDGFSVQPRFRRSYIKPTPDRRAISLSRSKFIADVSSRHAKVSKKPIEQSLTSFSKPAPKEANNSVVDNQEPIAVGVTAIPVTKHKLDFLAKPLRALRHKNKLQLALLAVATLMIVSGGYISYTTWQTNREAKLQANKLTAQANKAYAHGATTTTKPNQPLSTTKPSASAVAAYKVGPDQPKDLIIPAIKVDARILQVGVLSSGALGTPDNVFDTAWYTGSALPGQPGATLIDGHVSSWTSEGVFYNLHTLKAGDTIQIVKGDNTVVNYVVVRSQVYSASDVDMTAAMTPVTPGVSGLNLITCTGDVIKGTSLFNERVVVFAQEVS